MKFDFKSIVKLYTPDLLKTSNGLVLSSLNIKKIEASYSGSTILQGSFFDIERENNYLSYLF